MNERYRIAKCPVCGGTGEVTRAINEPLIPLSDIEKMAEAIKGGASLRAAGKPYGMNANTVKYYIKRYL